MFSLRPSVDARSLDPNTYRPRSQEWHTATEEGPCEICLAGGLIAGTFNVSPNRTMFPYMFSADTERKLEALDYMRLGKWARGLHRRSTAAARLVRSRSGSRSCRCRTTAASTAGRSFKPTSILSNPSSLDLRSIERDALIL